VAHNIRYVYESDEILRVITALSHQETLGAKVCHAIEVPQYIVRCMMMEMISLY